MWMMILECFKWIILLLVNCYFCIGVLLIVVLLVEFRFVSNVICLFYWIFK